MAETSDERSSSYLQDLGKLTSSLPLISEALTHADQQRSRRLETLAKGARLKGLEQFYAFLDAQIVNDGRILTP